MTERFDGWIERVLARADELRKKGVLSIGVDGCTASFAPAEPAPPPADTGSDDEDPAWSEPMNPFEDPGSYPSGIVPQLEIDDLREERR